MQIARDALDLAKDVDHRVSSHEDICALRYARLEENMTAARAEMALNMNSLKNDMSAQQQIFKEENKDIKRILAWAGTTAFGVILAALGFLMVEQFNANAEMQRTLHELQMKSDGYERHR